MRIELGTRNARYFKNRMELCYTNSLQLLYDEQLEHFCFLTAYHKLFYDKTPGLSAFYKPKYQKLVVLAHTFDTKSR